MNRRIKKKKEKPIIEICKNIKTDFCVDAIEYFNLFLNEKVIYKIVKKTYKDKFNIEEYAIYDIDGDEDGCIVYFINESDKKKSDKWRAIAFWVESKKNGVAIPNVEIQDVLYEVDTCQNAVWLMQ